MQERRMEEEMNKFWMVWGPSFANPEVQHGTLSMAQTEAARLAKKYPGENFIILESLGHYRKSEIFWEPHTS